MNVKELIESLKAMPQDADVAHLWDGKARTNIEVVYLARNGVVITADFDQVCYDDSDRPQDGPTEAEEKYWSTPMKPGETR